MGESSRSSRCVCLQSIGISMWIKKALIPSMFKRSVAHMVTHVLASTLSDAWTGQEARNSIALRKSVPSSWHVVFYTILAWIVESKTCQRHWQEDDIWANHAFYPERGFDLNEFLLLPLGGPKHWFHVGQIFRTRISISCCVKRKFLSQLEMCGLFHCRTITEICVNATKFNNHCGIMAYSHCPVTAVLIALWN